MYVFLIPLKNGICTTSEYFFLITPIQILPVNKRLRNLGRIQFIAKSSSIKKNLFAPQVQDLLEKLAEIKSPLQLSLEHILLKLKLKQLLWKIMSKNLTAGV